MSQPLNPVTDRILSAATALALENSHDQISTGISCWRRDRGVECRRTGPDGEGVTAEGIRKRLLARKALRRARSSSASYTDAAARPGSRPR